MTVSSLSGNLAKPQGRDQSARPTNRASAAPRRAARLIWIKERVPEGC
jgi:hypothetical protein